MQHWFNTMLTQIIGESGTLKLVCLQNINNSWDHCDAWIRIYADDSGSIKIVEKERRWLLPPSFSFSSPKVSLTSGMLAVPKVLSAFFQQNTSIEQRSKVPSSSSPSLSPLSSPEDALPTSSSSSSSLPPPSYEKVIAEDLSKLNTKQVQQAVSLAQVATDMQQHQWTTALEVYLLAVEKMITALPCKGINSNYTRFIRWLQNNTYVVTITTVETDADVREALVSKLERCNVIDRQQCVYRAGDGPGTAGVIESIIVFAAIALKRSPIPKMLACCFAYVLAGLQSLDEALCIRQRAWRITTQGFQKVVEIDQQFRIHQVILNAFYAVLLSLYKAGLAYAEAWRMKKLA